LHVCLFDIDGTLIASGGAGKSALEAALTEEFGLERMCDSIKLSGRTDRAILAELMRVHCLEATPATASRIMTAYLRHLPSHLGSGTGRILPGILELLTHLRERADVGLGLLTGNIRAGAQVKLSHFGLWEFFAFGGYGDEHEDRDDVARAVWREVATRFDGAVTPERAWVIGDTPLDIRCARAIGAQVAAVATGWHTAAELASHQPDLLLDDLSDATAFLSRWAT
jgi:phosphoglycolate phosphatase-like HAD superfamily hydrolase